MAKKKPIVSKEGQWKYPGQETIIPNVNGRITMQGVPYPVLGIDDLGNQQMMMPGAEYKFPGNSVYEIPMAKNGGTRKVKIHGLPRAQGGTEVPPEYETIKITDPNDPRYLEYLYLQNLYNWSNLQDFDQRDIFKDPGYYYGNVGEDYKNAPNEYSEEYTKHTTQYRDGSPGMFTKPFDPTSGNINYQSDDVGVYNSKANEFNFATKAQLDAWMRKNRSLNPGIYSSNPVWADERQYWNEIVNKYQPIGYDAMIDWNDPSYGSNLDADYDFNKKRWIYKKPNTQFIEDEIDRAGLRKIYPQLTDKEIDEYVERTRLNPEYITNILNPVTGKNLWIHDYSASNKDINKKHPLVLKQPQYNVYDDDGNVIGKKDVYGDPNYSRAGTPGYLQDTVIDWDQTQQARYLPRFGPPESYLGKRYEYEDPKKIEKQELIQDDPNKVVYTLDHTDNGGGVAYLRKSYRDADGNYHSDLLGSTLTEDWMTPEQQTQFDSPTGGSMSVQFNPNVKLWDNVQDPLKIIDDRRGYKQKAINMQQKATNEVDAEKAAYEQYQQQLRDKEKARLKKTAEQIESEKKAGGYAYGGPLPKAQFGLATAADSSLVANHANDIVNFYKNAGYIKDKTYPIYPKEREQTFRSIGNERLAPGTSKYGAKYKNGQLLKLSNGDYEPVWDTDIYQKLDNYKFQQRENAQGILNMDSPMQLYDTRISPQYLEFFNDNQPGGTLDNVGLYSYDKLAVTPWKKLTTKQRIQRLEKFGTSGSPYKDKAAAIKELKEKLNPPKKEETPVVEVPIIDKPVQIMGQPEDAKIPFKPDVTRRQYPIKLTGDGAIDKMIMKLYGPQGELTDNGYIPLDDPKYNPYVGGIGPTRPVRVSYGKFANGGFLPKAQFGYETSVEKDRSGAPWVQNDPYLNNFNTVDVPENLSELPSYRAYTFGKGSYAPVSSSDWATGATKHTSGYTKFDDKTGYLYQPNESNLQDFQSIPMEGDKEFNLRRFVLNPYEGEQLTHDIYYKKDPSGKDLTIDRENFIPKSYSKEETMDNVFKDLYGQNLYKFKGNRDAAYDATKEFMKNRVEPQYKGKYYEFMNNPDISIYDKNNISSGSKMTARDDSATAQLFQEFAGALYEGKDAEYLMNLGDDERMDEINKRVYGDPKFKEKLDSYNEALQDWYVTNKHMTPEQAKSQVEGNIYKDTPWDKVRKSTGKFQRGGDLKKVRHFKKLETRPVFEEVPDPEMIDIKPFAIPQVEVKSQLGNIPQLPVPQTNKQRVIINTPQGDKIRVQDPKTKKFMWWEDQKGLPSDIENPTGIPYYDFKFANGGNISVPDLKRVKIHALPKAQEGGDFNFDYNFDKSFAENTELNRRAQAMGWNSVKEYEASNWGRKGYVRVPDVIRQQRIAKGIPEDQIPEYEKIETRVSQNHSPELQAILKKGQEATAKTEWEQLGYENRFYNYKNDADFFDSHARLNNNSRSNDWIKDRVLSGDWEYNPVTQETRRVSPENKANVSADTKFYSKDFRTWTKEDKLAHPKLAYMYKDISPEAKTEFDQLRKDNVDFNTYADNQEKEEGKRMVLELNQQMYRNPIYYAPGAIFMGAVAAPAILGAELFGGVTVGQALNTGMFISGVDNTLDPNSDMRKSWSKAYNNPTGANNINALKETGWNALNFLGAKSAVGTLDDMSGILGTQFNSIRNDINIIRNPGKYARDMQWQAPDDLFNMGKTGNSGLLNSQKLRLPVLPSKPPAPFEPFNLNQVVKANGKIGNQGFTEEGARNILNSIGVNVQSLSPAGPTFGEMVNHLKTNPTDAAKFQKFLEREPISVSELPGGEFQINDGHHRAALSYHSGNTDIPAIIKNKGEYTGFQNSLATPSNEISGEGFEKLKEKHSIKTITDKAELDKIIKDNPGIEQVSLTGDKWPVYLNNPSDPAQQTRDFLEQSLRAGEDFTLNWALTDPAAYKQIRKPFTDYNNKLKLLDNAKQSVTTEISKAVDDIHDKEDHLFIDYLVKEKGLSQQEAQDISYGNIPDIKVRAAYWQELRPKWQADLKDDFAKIGKLQDKVQAAEQAYSDHRKTLFTAVPDMTKMIAESDALIDPRYKSRIENLFKESGISMPSHSNLLNSVDPGASKLVFYGQNEPSFKGLSQNNKDYLNKSFQKVEGFKSSDATVTLGGRNSNTVDEPMVYFQRPGYLREEYTEMQKPGPAKLFQPNTWLNPYKKPFPVVKSKYTPIEGAYDKPVLIHDNRMRMSNPTKIEETSTHETGHDISNVYNWIDSLVKYDPKYNYNINDVTNPFAKRFADAMVDPVPTTKLGDDHTSETWHASIGELHSELMIARLRQAKKLMLEENIKMPEAIQKIKDAEDRGSFALFNNYLSKYASTDGGLDKHFKPGTTFSEKTALLMRLPKEGYIPKDIGDYQEVLRQSRKHADAYNANSELARANQDALTFTNSPANKAKLQTFRPGQNFSVTNQTARFIDDPEAIKLFGDYDPSMSIEKYLGNSRGAYGARDYGDMKDVVMVDKFAPHTSNIPSKSIYTDAIHEDTHSRSIRLQATDAEKQIATDAWKPMITEKAKTEAFGMPEEEAFAVQNELRMDKLKDIDGTRVYTEKDIPEIKKGLDEMINQDYHTYLKGVKVEDFDMKALINSLNKIGLGVGVGVVIGAGATQEKKKGGQIRKLQNGGSPYNIPEQSYRDPKFIRDAEDREYYDPQTETIHMRSSYPNFVHEQWVKDHETAHHNQKLKGKLSSTENWPGPLKEPVVPMSEDDVMAYYNRGNIDVNNLIDAVPESTLFGMPDDVLGYGFQLKTYGTPGTAEYEASNTRNSTPRTLYRGKPVAKNAVAKTLNREEKDPEMMFKDKYNTSLTKEEEEEFNNWIKTESKQQGRDIMMDKGAYDIQGFWKSGDWKKRDADNHGTDTWKKPNHPTFSNQSKYHGAGGWYGGNWTEQAGYQPSKQTLNNYGLDYYNWLFNNEPNRPEHLDMNRYDGENMGVPVIYKQGGSVKRVKINTLPKNWKTK